MTQKKNGRCGIFFFLLLRQQSETHLFHLERNQTTFIDMNNNNGVGEARKSAENKKKKLHRIFYTNGIDSKKQLPFCDKHKRTHTYKYYSALQYISFYVFPFNSLGNLKFIPKIFVIFFFFTVPFVPHWTKEKEKFTIEMNPFWNFHFGN